MQNNSWIWWLIALIVVVGGGYWWWMASSADMADDQNGAAGTVEEGSGLAPDDTDNTGSNAPMSATVTYSGGSFSPATVTIARGGRVTFTSTENMWVASDEHPTHTAYAGTSRQEHCPAGSATAFDQCAPGTSYSFTFDKSGTWEYHNHLSASAGGTVIVE